MLGAWILGFSLSSERGVGYNGLEQGEAGSLDASPISGREAGALWVVNAGCGGGQGSSGLLGSLLPQPSWTPPGSDPSLAAEANAPDQDPLHPPTGLPLSRAKSISCSNPDLASNPCCPDEEVQHILGTKVWLGVGGGSLGFDLAHDEWWGGGSSLTQLGALGGLESCPPSFEHWGALGKGQGGGWGPVFPKLRALRALGWCLVGALDGVLGVGAWVVRGSALEPGAVGDFRLGSGVGSMLQPAPPRTELPLYPPGHRPLTLMGQRCLRPWGHQGCAPSPPTPCWPRPQAGAPSPDPTHLRLDPAPSSWFSPCLRAGSAADPREGGGRDRVLCLCLLLLTRG